MPSNRVVIRIQGGIPEVESSPDGIIVEVHDYDLEGYDYEKGVETGAICKDEYDDLYWKKIL